MSRAKLYNLRRQNSNLNSTVRKLEGQLGKLVKAKEAEIATREEIEGLKIDNSNLSTRVTVLQSKVNEVIGEE